MAKTKFLDSAGLTHLLEKTNSKFSKIGHTHTKAEITDFAHNHNDLYYDKSKIDSKLNGKSNTGHTHDDRYYTETEINSKLSGKANSSHTHTKSQITDFPSSMKNPNSLTISLNGTSQGAYDGSAAKSINVTPSSIGAATSGHTHNVTKSDVGLGSVDNTSDANKSVKYAKSATANNPIKTTGTGAAYAATVDGITALTIGAKFTMVPHTVSTTTAPTLNVNGLGAKNIRIRLTSSTTATIQLTSASFLTANKPVNVVYDGSYWVIDDFAQPDVNSLYGTVPISKGGTGATTAAKALANLGAMPKANITIGTDKPTSSTSGIFYIQTN